MVKDVRVNQTCNDPQILTSLMICRSKTQEGSQEVLNVLVFLEDFIFYSGLSRKVCKLFQKVEVFHWDHRRHWDHRGIPMIEEGTKCNEPWVPHYAPRPVSNCLKLHPFTNFVQWKCESWCLRQLGQRNWPQFCRRRLVMLIVINATLGILLKTHLIVDRFTKFVVKYFYGMFGLCFIPFMKLLSNSFSSLLILKLPRTSSKKPLKMRTAWWHTLSCIHCIK